MGVHIIALSAVLHWFRMLTFDSGQLIATILAMVSNFILNNEITYRPYRYRRFGQMGGFVAFALGCSVGALANIDVASWLYKANQTWWAAGLAGALLSVVWNYAVSMNLILATRSPSLRRPPNALKPLISRKEGEPGRLNRGDSRISVRMIQAVWVGRPAGMPTPLWTFSFAP